LLVQTDCGIIRPNNNIAITLIIIDTYSLKLISTY